MTPFELSHRRRSLCENHPPPQSEFAIKPARQAGLSPAQQQQISHHATSWIEAGASTGLLSFRDD